MWSSTDIGVLLHTKDVDLLLLHLCQDIKGDEARGLAVEKCHVVGGNLKTLLAVGSVIDGVVLEKRSNIGNAAEQCQGGDGGPVPAPTDEPVDEQ